MAAEDLRMLRTENPGDQELHALVTRTLQQLDEEDIFGVYERVHTKGGVYRPCARHFLPNMACAWAATHFDWNSPRSHLCLSPS